MFAANIQALTRDDLARALMELPTNRLFALRQRLEQRPLLIALLLAGLAALLYLPSVSFGFLGYDDHWLVAKNPILLQPSTGTLHTVFFDLSARSRYLLGSEYLPLRDLSVFVELALVGPDPRLMHLDNVLLYALGCGLLFLALKAWLSDTRLAAVAVLIYLAHPIHVESVAWLSERKGVLALVFVSASLLAFHRFALRGRLAWLLISVLLFVCAIWSKGLAIATFGVLVLLVWQHWPSSTKPSTRAKWLGLSLWFVAALLAFAPIYSTGQKLQLVGAFHGGSFGATAALMGEVHARYVGLMLLASKQGIAYPIQSATVQPLLSLFGWTLVALFAGSILYALLRSRARVPALAAGFWLVFLLPVSQLIFPLQNAMADRYLLLPSIGACLALAYAVRSIPFNWGSARDHRRRHRGPNRPDAFANPKLARRRVALSASARGAPDPPDADAATRPTRATAGPHKDREVVAPPCPKGSSPLVAARISPRHARTPTRSPRPGDRSAATRSTPPPGRSRAG
jgi:hypothetical protein